MNTKLYVGNLPYDIVTADLEKLFTTVGTVKSVNIIMDNFTGKAKGFGFIEMDNQQDANSAISDLNGSEIMGRAIKVNAAKENSERREPRNRY